MRIRRNRFLQTAGSFIPAVVISFFGIATGLSGFIWVPVAALQGIWSVVETEFVQRFRGHSVGAVSESSALALWAGIGAFVGLALALFEAALMERSGSVVFGVIGISLGLAGVILRLLAIRILGPLFLDQIALLPNHEIETSGIYRFMRHPGEVGFLFAVLGPVIISQSVIGSGVFLMWLLPLSLVRIHQENKMIDNYG